ncbi:MAG: hypothetical protein ACOC56_00615 [Atribacterota bacterium]
MGRSGYHAVLFYLMKQYNDYYFVNHAYKWYPKYDKISDPKLRDKYTEKYNNTNFFISLENFDFTRFLEEYNKEDFYKQMQNDFFGQCYFYKNIIVMRDPFNHFASRFKKNLKHKKDRPRRHASNKKLIDKFKPLWIKYAKEVLGDTNYIPDKYVILYNKWFTDIEYRKKICEDFGVQCDDAHREYIPKFGCGSSFSSCLKQGHGSNLDVLNRWQVFEDNSSFRECFQDKILYKLSERIFGHIVGTEQLL